MRHLFRFLTCFGLLIGGLAGLPARPARADNSQPSNVFLPLLVNGGDLSSQAQEPATLQSFIQSVGNGDPGAIKGVFAPGVLAQPVAQQPAGDYGFISNGNDDLTQFSLAQAPAVGFIAHNSLAGARFFKLTVGQDLYLVMGDGSARHYRVSQVNRYQAVNPDDPASDFIDTQTGQTLSAAQLFAAYYLGQDQATFQTCILEDGNPSWGRLFVSAVPAG